MASRVANAKLVKKSIIEDNRSKLLNAPVKEREEFSMSEAIHQIADEITEVLGRGYSYDEVANMLSAGGIDIKGTTLRQYMTAMKRDISKTKPRKKKSDAKKVPSDTSFDENISSESNDIIAKSKSKSAKLSAKSTVVSNTPSVIPNSSSGQKSDGFVDMPNEL
jgi:predicted AAA+ superfamily ATPase